ncbi:radical SAM protein [Candidatus Bathyarchaeota archaeon A05DMB-2]|nr:radical SAM protein [Candidatus Bathyarchaeota archaeon A05DMB-2]
MKKTKSICPVCQKKIDAEISVKDDRILITKRCPEHGVFTATHWQSPRIFGFTEDYDYFKYFEDPKASSNPDGCPYICGSCSHHTSDTVIGVIDVTKKCDLRCAVCFSTFSDHIVDYEPTKAELVNILTFLSKRDPKPPAILFSGGEPLEREDMPEIIGTAHRLKFMTILATNGIHLAENPELAAKLKQNGLNIVYLQFDSFRDSFYEKIRGRKLLDLKYKAVDVCRKLDMEVILVTTLMRGFNDQEVGKIVRFAAVNSDIIRGLIFQPIAFTGRATDNPFQDAWREWRFAEDVELQTNGEIKTTDFFPLGVMVSPIKIMRKFMKKPWPLFSCSPHCGIVNWMYVSKSGKIIPINHFVDFEKFFRLILKTAQNVDSKGRFSLLASLFMASMRSLDMLLVTKEVGIFTLMRSILKMHISPSYQSLGSIRRRIFLLGCMAFMDPYNFDVNRVRRCVIHYVTPDLKVIPFCAYNNVHRIETEEEYASRGLAK